MGRGGEKAHVVIEAVPTASRQLAIPRRVRDTQQTASLSGAVARPRRCRRSRHILNNCPVTSLPLADSQSIPPRRRDVSSKTGRSSLDAAAMKTSPPAIQHQADVLHGAGPCRDCRAARPVPRGRDHPAQATVSSACWCRSALRLDLAALPVLREDAGAKVGRQYSASAWWRSATPGRPGSVSRMQQHRDQHALPEIADQRTDQTAQVRQA